MAQIQRLTIPVFNVGGLVTETALTRDVRLIQTPDGAIERWRNIPFLSAVVPEGRWQHARLCIEIERATKHVAPRWDVAVSELVFSVCAVLGLFNDAYLETPFTEFVILNVDGANENELHRTAARNLMQPPVAHDMNPRNAMMLDRTDVRTLKQALKAILRRNQVVPASRYALSRWYMAKSRFLVEDALVDAWIGLEGLYLYSGEARKSPLFRRMPQFLYEHRGVSRSVAQARARGSYDVRNAVVHGDVPTMRQLRKAKDDAIALLRASLLTILSHADLVIDFKNLESGISRIKAAKAKKPNVKPRRYPRRAE